MARLEGIYPETAGGVTLAAAAAARRRGVIRDGDEVVALLTGNGLKTPGRALARARRRGRPAAVSPVSRPSIRPSLSAFERWLGGRRVSTVRIPPTLRVATGGEKRVEVGGATVRERRDARSSALHPGLESQLIGPDGDLNPFVNAFLNDTDIRHLQGLDTPVADRDTLALLPAMAGG